MNLRCPWPPSTNHAYPSSKWGRRYLSKAGQEYKESMQAIVSENGCPKLSGRLAVCIDLYPPDKRKRDIGNHEKVLIDSLVACGVMDDDEQIDELLIRRKEIVPDGEAVVWIKEIV